MKPRATRDLPGWADWALLPALNLVLALLIAAAVVALVGESPLQAFRLMARGAFGSQEGIGYTLFYTTDFLFTGLAVAVAFHAGHFNIGGEGQAYVGGLGISLAALYLGHWPFWLFLPTAIAAGALFGAAWAAIPAWLQAKRGSHIVITTIMMNFLASALMTYLLVNVLIAPDQQSPESAPFPRGALMPSARALLGDVGLHFTSTPLNLTFPIALVACALVWLLLWRTKWGYALRVAGASPGAAAYAGISPGAATIWAMLISGALAGCVGLNELLGSQHNLILDFVGGAGFVGIAVALMGRNHPLGILAAALLFGALYQGGSELSFDMPHVNRDLVVAIQGLVVLLCGALEGLLRAPLAALFARLGDRGRATAGN